MKKLLGLASMVALMAGLPLNAAQAQMYIEGSGGITNQDSLDWGGSSYDMDQGWNASAAVGHRMWTNWDVEVELSYDEMEYSCCNPNNTHEYRLMLNGTYNFTMGGFVPYAGGGIGFAQVTYENSGGESEGTVGAYQLIGGVRVPVGETWSLFGEYRFQDTLEDPEDGTLVWEHQGSNFALGVRLNLN